MVSRRRHPLFAVAGDRLFILGNEYLLVFLPFAAIAIGKQVEGALSAWRRTVLVLCLLLLAGAAVWTREGLCRNQAIWTLAERLHERGIATGRFRRLGMGGYYHFDDTPGRLLRSRQRPLPIL